MSEKPWVKMYDKGVPPTIEYPEVTLQEIFEQTAARFPDHPCTIFKGAVITYREMDEITDRVAAGLAALGVKKGDRVGLFVLNTPQFIMAYYGILKAGGVVVATNPLYSGREIVHQVNDANIETMILMTNNYEKVKAVQDQTKIRTIIATNLKETLPPVLRMLFTLAREKRYSVDTLLWL